MSEYPAYLPDINQNYFQLSCIQSAALGLSGMLIGGQLIPQYGAGTAILSVCIGNLILWGLAYAIVSMSLPSRENGIENIKEYVGTWPCIFSSLVLTIGYLSWTIEENLFFIKALGSLEKWDNNTELYLGVSILIIIALLSLRGIRLIKQICVYAFPFLILFVIYQSIFSYENYSEIIKGPWSISFFAVIAIVAQNLAGIVNLPTFFRHARSKQDAFLALTLMTGFVSLFQIFGIIVGISNPINFFAKVLPSGSGIFAHILAISFVILSTLCVNLVNIYFASAGWEAISNILRSISTKWNSKAKLLLRYILIPHGFKYEKALGVVCMINGICAALFFLIFPNLKQDEFFEAIADNSLSSLGIVLLLAFLTKIFEHHRPKSLERTVSGICWLIGGFTAIFTQITTQESNQALVAGATASFLAYLAAIFIEVSYSSTMDLFRKKSP